MTRSEIAGGKGTIDFGKSQVVRLNWAAGESVSGDDAAAAIAELNRLCHGNRYPLLITVADVNFSRAARTAFSSPSSASRIALLGSSPVDRVIANFFLRLHSLPCPTMFFTNAGEAMTWLAEADASTNPPQAPSA